MGPSAVGPTPTRRQSGTVVHDGRLFADRHDAGRRLAELLQHLRGEPAVVVGLPRGGVPVAYEVARALEAPLDVIVVRKLGVPFEPEFAMGAIGEGGSRVIDWEVVRMAGVSEEDLADVEMREREEVERQARRYRGARHAASLDGRVAVVVDDGIATGATARAACQVARARGAARVVLAVPVAPRGWAARIGDADECVSVETPDMFFAIGQFYVDFSPVSDAEVAACLERAAPRPSAPVTVPGSAAPDVLVDLDDPADDSTGERLGTPLVRPAEGPLDALDEDVEIGVDGVVLRGHLRVPERAPGLVVFAHGSGSSRHSPRNRYVASVLGEAGLGTLLFDLLTSAEEGSRANVFDIELLAGRLTAVTHWLGNYPECKGLHVGYFGASTGAGAALWAASEPGNDITATVSRGGRPDLAGSRLSQVRAPTLLIVGGRDAAVLDLNERARLQLRCEARLAVVPGATHLFEEPGTLQMAAELARDWFLAHFPPRLDSPG